ncbi:MAG: MacB family efflux pump subunit [Sulfurimonadaceae bacterium]|jgi:macrolide transport system ATP-binding/permease protein|nr:MacB family efflux pump subunit [Sulfurimonadaceae bacterium]
MQTYNPLQDPVISLRGIGRVFKNGDLETRVLDGIDLDIYAGEFVAIIGSSGSGKSTLMNIMGCLDKPSEGEYIFAGDSILKFSKSDLAQLRREAFGFVFQSYNLIHAHNATENVALPAVYAGMSKDERNERAEKLLTHLGLGHRLDYRPSQLSGGQQQRVCIARALMNGGQILFADEPTGALDSKSGEEVIGLLNELSQKGHTIILITHDSEVAKHADRLIEIKDGRIVNNQTPTIPTTVKELEKIESKASFVSEILESTVAAFHSLRMNLFRTILTLLGIMIGVASVIAMLAIGDGAKYSVMERIGAMGTNLLIIRPGMPNTRGYSDIATLVPEDLPPLSELDNIIAAVPETRNSVTTRYGNNDQLTMLNATGADYVKARDWSVEKGTFFTQEDDDNIAKVAVIGKTLETALFGEEDSLGEFIIVNNIMFQVIGVMSQKGASAFGEDQDDVLFVPYSTGSLHLIGQRVLRSATVALEDLEKREESEATIRKVLLERHGVEDFRVINMASLIQDAAQTQSTLTILLGSIAAISLLVGGIGVMNIMLVSVTERTKEIGVRVAIGARENDILVQFLIESLVVSALGGAIGVFLGLGVSYIVGTLGMPVHYSLMPVILAFGSSFLTGLLFGYLPAKKAANLDPVVALMSE